jgi:Ankyrin repeats (many copies)/IPT/TIG domain
MITDDHKTHPPPAPMTNGPGSSDNATKPTIDPMFSASQNFEMPPTYSGAAPIGHSYSSSDLTNLQRNMGHFQGPPSYTSTQNVSSSTTASSTPRNGLSRHASPSATSGPTAKKRKASNTPKVPAGLAMTRMEGQGGQSSAGPSTRAPSAHASPYSQSMHSFGSPQDTFAPGMPSMPMPYVGGPPTPNSNDQHSIFPAQRSQSMENLAMAPPFSTPPSAHPSRPASPTRGVGNGPNAMYQQAQAAQAAQAQAQMAQMAANQYYGMPMALNPQRPPTIHKLIPNEGPKTGGIEVTCLGSGFCQGLEVMFGDSLATTTTYWGDTSLVCLLPPAMQAGTVSVTFKHERQQLQPMQTLAIPKQQVFFKYIDDEEQQLLRLALSVVGQKMTGRMEDVRDIALRIVQSSGGSGGWAQQGGTSPAGGQQHRRASGLEASELGLVDLDVEAALLKCLDLIDLDDSPNAPRLNMRRPSGQTMLHLASSLGMHRFVAGLLARGATPDPRDKGGYTPMHFAALHDHSQIVRRLLLSGADPTMRSLQGYTPADFATSEEVLNSTRTLQNHRRQRSAGSINFRSRNSSAASLKSLWDHQASAPASRTASVSDDASEEESTDEDQDDVEEVGEQELWMRSRRNSGHASAPLAMTSQPLQDNANAAGALRPQLMNLAGLPNPAAAMAAWRDQLSAQIASLQQNMHWQLPNLPNLPHLPQMPAILSPLPAYHNYLPTPMARMSSFIPGRASSRDGPPAEGAEKNGDYKWWELFSVPNQPPAYEEIYPQQEGTQQQEHQDMDAKKNSAALAAVDAIADAKCAEAFHEEVGESSSSAASAGRASPVSTESGSMVIGKRFTTKKEQDDLRAAHARKLKKINSDRKLFLVWIPLLAVVVLAMLFNKVPQVWKGAEEIYEFVQTRRGVVPGGQRVVEV